MYRVSVIVVRYRRIGVIVNTLILLTDGEGYPSWAGSWLLWRNFTVGFRCEWFSSVLQVGFYRQLAILFMLYLLEVDVNTETMQEFTVVTVQVHTYYISMYNQYQVRSYNTVYQYGRYI